MSTYEVHLWYKGGEKECTRLLDDTARKMQLQVATRSDSLAYGGYLELAKAISQRASEIGQSPADLSIIIAVLQSVIRGRREAAVLYRRAPNEGDKEQRDDNHEDVINRLDSMLRILRDLYKDFPPRPTAPKCKTTTAVKPSADLRNKTVLDDLASSSEPAVTRGVLTDDASVQNEDDNDDERQHILRFFEQVSAVRGSLQSANVQHSQGEITLPVLALLTQAASNLLKKAARDLCKRFPAFECFDVISECIELTTPSGEATEPSAATDVFCAPALTTLRLLHQYLAQRQLDIEDEEDLASQICASHPFAHVLFELLEPIRRLAPDWDELPQKEAFDQFTRSFIGFCSSWDLSINIDLVVQLQIQMDSFDFLKSSNGSAYEAYRRTAEAAKKSLSEFQSDMKTFGSYSKLDPSRLQEEISRDLQFGADWASLLERLPMLAGLFMHAIVRRQQDAGISTCMVGAVVSTSAHIYRACRAGRLTVVWEDMDSFITMQDPKSLGLGDLTGIKPFLNAKNKFEVALGIQSSNESNRNDLRREQPTTQGYTTSIAAHWRDPIHTPSFLMSKLKESEIAMNDIGLNDGKMPSIIRDVARHMKSNHAGALAISTKKTLQKKLGNGRPLSNFSTLEVLKACFILDEKALRFDYHAFYVKCSRLLSDLGNAGLLSSFKREAPCYFIRQLLIEAAEREQRWGSAFHMRDCSMAIQKSLLSGPLDQGLRNGALLWGKTEDAEDSEADIAGTAGNEKGASPYGQSEDVGQSEGT